MSATVSVIPTLNKILKSIGISVIILAVSIITTAIVYAVLIKWRHPSDLVERELVFAASTKNMDDMGAAGLSCLIIGVAIYFAALIFVAKKGGGRLPTTPAAIKPPAEMENIAEGSKFESLETEAGKIIEQYTKILADFRQVKGKCTVLTPGSSRSDSNQPIFDKPGDFFAVPQLESKPNVLLFIRQINGDLTPRSWSITCDGDSFSYADVYRALPAKYTLSPLCKNNDGIVYGEATEIPTEYKRFKKDVFVKILNRVTTSTADQNNLHIIGKCPDKLVESRYSILTSFSLVQDNLFNCLDAPKGNRKVKITGVVKDVEKILYCERNVYHSFFKYVLDSLRKDREQSGESGPLEFRVSKDSDSKYRYVLYPEFPKTLMGI